MQHWLFKTEPDVFSIEMLEALNGAAEPWTGVRNYLARNHMRSMAVGDLGLLYHSSCKVPGAAGVCRVVRTGLPDPSALDPKSEYFDPKSTPENVRWDMVEVAFVARFEPLVSLAALREDPFFTTMPLLARGQRLSVQPVQPEHFHRIVALGGAKL
jgi:predicted RNA-binding protein with PUA-like domain